MKFFILILLLLILLLLIEVSGFNSEKAASLCSRRDYFLVTKDLGVEDEKIDNKDKNHCDCERGGFGIVQKIYYAENSDIVDISFSSACVRCGLCLAIADKINKTLIDMHDAMSPDQRLIHVDTDADELFNMICNQSFISYRLRELNGKKYIGESLPSSVLIESNADGLWVVKLKEKCNDLIEAIGADNFYKHWQDWYYQAQNKKLSQILCHSDVGMLRDCRSFDESLT